MRRLALVMGLFGLLGHGVFGFETVIPFTGGNLEGEMTLNARHFPGIRDDVAESVRFPGGLTVSHVFLPDYRAFCSNVYPIGLILKSERPSRYLAQAYGGGDAWGINLRFPDLTAPFDSLYADTLGGDVRKVFRGIGYLHSTHNLIACASTTVTTLPDFNRIVFHSGANHVSVRFQVTALLPDTVPCRTDIADPPMCEVADKVRIRYQVTDDPSGNFPNPAAGTRAAVKIRAVRDPRASLSLYDLVLGRMFAPRR